jgi:hypothetical protein
MKAGTEKALNLANMLLGVGMLLLIVPIGFGIITLTTTDGQSAMEALTAVAWVFMVILLALPIGLGAFVGGLTWMVYLKRRAKIEDIEEDDEKDALENQ